MKAIIYAAGVGRRMGPRTANLPKVLLEFGGKTLLRRHLESLSAVGVREVVVVTGWHHERVDAEIERLLRDHPLRLEAVRNESFREGSALSVWAAEAHLTPEAAPLLLMDGDVLYGPEMLSRLLDSPSGTCLLLDRRCALNEADPVLVAVRGGRPFDFTKAYRGPYEEIGESIGFFKVGTRDVPRFREAARARTTGTRRSETLEDIVRELVQEGLFGREDVTGLPWIEIDFPQDVERALKEVLPALEAGGRASSSRLQAG